MITRYDGFSWIAPRISRYAFAAELHDSPVYQERNPVEYYDAITALHVEPTFVLAVFTKESNRGRNPEAVCVANDTHSWGNTRNEPYHASVDADGNPITVDTRHGKFMVYPDWLAGCESTAFHLSQPGYNGLTIEQAIQKWAPGTENDTERYIQFVVDELNRLCDNRSGENDTTGGATMRVIVSAGHENIQNLPGNDGGYLGADAVRLSHGTGANGEEPLNAATADELVRLLAAGGIDAVRTDAVYHQDVYGSPANLCLFIHGDGVNDPNAPQHAGAVPVLYNADQNAINLARDFCDTYKRVAPAITGIGNENLDTNDMDYLYSGRFVTDDTPTAIVETCIVGYQGGTRDDALKPDVAAHALAFAISEWGKAHGYLSSDGSGSGNGGKADTGGTTGGTGGGTGDTGGGTADSGSGTDSGGIGKWGTAPDNSRTVTRRVGSATNYRDYTIGHGFADYVYDNGGQSNGFSDQLGEPLTNEFVISRYHDGTPNQPVTVQIFEYGALKWAGGDNPVERLRLGAEYLDLLFNAGIPLPTDAWRY